MGEVSLAEDLLLHRKLALKFLFSSGGGAVDQLLAEARAAAALDHPFICAIFEVTSLDNRPCIAMEYVRGETLDRRLRAGPLPGADGLRVAEEIAEALDAAHRRRIIHRDLKPANVMLTEDGHVKVMDFGLATRLPGDELTGDRAHRPDDSDAQVRGTPAYMAPEQIRGEPVDRRSDIFSFGILVYQMLSGVNPFARTGIDATLAAILAESAADLHVESPAIPPALGVVVAKMLAKDPAARYQSFAEIRRDLRAAAAHLTLPPAPIAVVVEQPTAAATTSLIGRDAERAQLMQIVRQGAAGSGTLVALMGEAGIGKSRLADEALAYARRQGCQTLVGRSYEQDGTPPLIPYIEVLESASRLMHAVAFREAIRACASELVRLLPELHRLFPDLTRPLELPPELRLRFLFTNVRDFLARASQLAPLVIMLDDLQWGDDSTLQLTQYLAQQIRALPIVIIAAYRDVDVPPAASKGTLQNLFDRVRRQGRDSVASTTASVMLGQLVAQNHARAVTLRPLSEGNARGVLAALARQDPPPPVAHGFFEQTGGNPFFITELFRHLKDEGKLFDASGRWRRQVEFDDAAVPDSVRVVIERRIQRVSRDTQNVLRAAAVIGRQFELDILEAIADVDEEGLLTALEEAEGAHLIKGPSGRQDVTWRFTHQVIPQTLAQATPSIRLQRLHLRAGEVLERLHSSARPYTAEIAHHLYSAGRAADPAKTARALMHAGTAANAMYATEEAIRHYRRALEVLDEAGGDNQARTAIQERLADLLALYGDPRAAGEHYLQLEDEYSQRQSGGDVARVARKRGTLQWQAGDRTAAMANYRRALQALNGTAPGVEAAHLYQELGLAAFRSGDNRQAIEWAERSLTAAEQALSNASPEERKDATRAIAHATNTIGVAMARLGELEAARQHIERSVAAARELGLLDVACRGYANLGVLYSTVEPQRAIDVSLTGLELASKIGAASLQSYIYANLATAYCALTDRCEAEGLQAAHAAADLDRQLGQLDHLAVPLIVIAQIHQCRGELADAERHYTEALTLAEKTGEAQLILPCYDGLATIHLDRGDRETATAYMERARELSEKTGVDPDSLLLLPFLS
jgi:adenylate cyclase